MSNRKKLRMSKRKKLINRRNGYDAAKWEFTRRCQVGIYKKSLL